MKETFNYLKENALFCILAISLVSSAIVIIPYGSIIYYSGMVYLFIYSLKTYSISYKFGNGFILFISVCLLSSLVNLTFDYRLFAFSILVITCTPITYSSKLSKFREKYLFTSLLIFPIISIASLYCYFAGINYFVVADGTKGRFIDFSAFFPHPMWLGAAVGLANVVLLWLIYEIKGKILRTIAALFLLFSIYLCVIAASRSALVASLLSMIIFIIVRCKNIKELIRIGSIITVVVALLLPLYLSDAKRMQDKFGNTEKYGSRTGVVTVGFKNFVENPILGVGFAVNYNSSDKREVGRMESGSGWLSILFQTGTVGLLVVIGIVYRLKKLYPYIKCDKKLQLYASTFLFLCFHSCFEGYILTVGYYLCILFWMLLGYLYTYPYSHKHI